jgi:hypothetical protein
MTTYRTLHAFAISTLLICGNSPAAEPRFAAQTIDERIEIGYGLAIGDVDGDRLPDVLLADKQEIVWYRNPGARNSAWPRHVMAVRLTEQDNVCIAARDLDGDGRVEVAVGANWNPGETSDVARSGAVFFLQRPADPQALWRAVPIGPYDPTTHRMHWVRWQEADYRLLVLPLHGRGNRDGQGNPVRLMAYRIPLDSPEQATADVVLEAWHMTHNFDFEPTTGTAPERLWVAGREGLAEVSAQQQRLVVPAPPSKGAGEVRIAHVTEPGLNLAAIEPMHGSEVVLYTQDSSGDWQRQVLDNSFNQGHALAAGDLLGLGRSQIVAGWRNPNADERVGIRLYIPNAEGTEWTRHPIDDNQMACEDLRLADLDGDGRIDVVGAGRATHNLVIYWNDCQSGG